jgi:hypothetical protein
MIMKFIRTRRLDENIHGTARLAEETPIEAVRERSIPIINLTSILIGDRNYNKV